MHWRIVLHPEVENWLGALADGDYESMVAALEMLRKHGPALGRPLVDSIRSSAHKNMKELRVRHYRCLFAFDSRREAIVLLGGSKKGRWESWYEVNLPIADVRFREHLERIESKDQGSGRHI